MKGNYFDQAVNIAIKEKYPEDIIAEINKEAGDKEYKLKNFDLAVDLYIKTIGYLNPSYVIQKYNSVSQLDNLIKYM